MGLGREALVAGEDTLPKKPDDELEQLSPRDGILKGAYAIVYEVRPPPSPPDIAKTPEPLGGRKPLRSRVAAGRVEDSTAEYFVVAGVRFYRRDVAAGVYEVEISMPKRERD
jgi:hypothetical protein